MGEVMIAGLSKAYGSVPVLNSVDLHIRNGEFFTLLGPSGCGKTTLLRSIAGFLSPDAGTIAYDGVRIDQLPAHRRDIGMVFQDYAVFPHLSVHDNIAFGLHARRLSSAEIAPRVAEAVRLVRLDGMERRMPAALSGGQQQRVGIARALAIRPRLLLMDEPLSNLDAKLRVEMREDIRDIQRALGLTTIYVTHDQEEALAISDRICVMNKGRIEQIGTPLEIYRRPARRFAAGFVGSMNFLAAVVDGDVMQFAERSWRLDRAASPGPIEIAIRPEAILVDEPTDDSGITIHGSVRKTTFLGRETHCTIETSVGEIVAQFPEARPELLSDEARTITVRLPFSRLALFRPEGEALDVSVIA